MVGAAAGPEDRRHMLKSLLPLLAAGAALLAAAPAHAPQLAPTWTGSGPAATLTQDGTKADPQLDYKASAFSGSWSLSAKAERAPTGAAVHPSPRCLGWVHGADKH